MQDQTLAPVLDRKTRPTRPPQFWLNAQRAVDLWDAAQAICDEIAGIKPLTVT